MIAPEVALILCRFLFYGAAIVLWGTSSYLCTLVPETLARQLGGRLRVYHVIAIMIVLAMTAALLPLRAATIGDGWSDAIDLRTIFGVLFETNVGTVWQAQAVCSILALLVIASPARRHYTAIAISSGLLLATQAITGHVAMDQGWLEAAHRINDIVHLLSGGAWLGSLLPVLMLFSWLRDKELGFVARVSLIRFSTAGHVAVAVVIVTGAINTLMIVGGLPLDWSFAYQVLLSTKTFLVVVMVLLAVVNRYVFVPRLSHHHPGPMKALVAATIAEIVVGSLVVGLVAWFGTLEPN